MKEVLAACGLSLPEGSEATPLQHVAGVGDKVVGCACGEQHGQTFVIHAVAVLPKYRGHQLATHIVSALLMRARSHGCSKAIVLTDEHPGFFARYGFTLTPADSIVREMLLSRDFLRRFGAHTHYMCRRL
ncbi:GNAT family N-acetyltransferase [Cupriavidus nantongensis]|uniref:GNAT family N-acetyltransferase n=1 Tax=Cupriavidus nantongensis TaxID=1796606 RepID=UPI0009ED067D|nr:GNAT family N-acetyltransferase [Cupriavidus nantongensis]